MCIRDRSGVVQGGWSRFCDERQRSIVIKIFNINRGYKDVISVLGVERAAHIMTVGNLVDDDEVVDDDEASGDNNDIIGDMIGNSDSTYLIMMSNPDDDRTVTDWYKTHDVDSYWFSMGNLNYDYYDIVVGYTNLNGFCVEIGNMREEDYSELCMYNIRLIYNDGGG